jgi:hypothetical protein
MNFRADHEWLRALARDTALSPRARVVALQVAREMAVSGRCELSYSLIAAACAIDRVAAVQAVRELTDRGWLGKLATVPKRANSYQLTIRGSTEAEIKVKGQAPKQDR